MNRRVAVLTTNRADYGLLRPLLKGIQSHQMLELSLIVSGTHLSTRHGRTVEEIRRDGFDITATIDLGIDEFSDDATDAAEIVAAMTTDFAALLARLRPDVLLVLGDRFELLGACIAAMLQNVPIAHVHGGEVTYGSIDDSVRHAISKLACLHFPVHPTYARRLHQMGESDDSVVLIDPPVSETLSRFEPTSVSALAELVGVDLMAPFVVLTFHPVTRLGERSFEELRELLSALSTFPELTVVATGSNSDPTGLAHQRLIDDFIQADASRRGSVTSLGHDQYLSLIHWSRGVVGNSSSGVIEAPMLGVPSLDVGSRQQGRLRPASVLHVPAQKVEVVRAIRELIQTPHSRPDHRAAPNSTRLICSTLAEHPLTTMKIFTDR